MTLRAFALKIKSGEGSCLAAPMEQNSLLKRHLRRHIKRETVYFFSDLRFWNRVSVDLVAISWRRCPSSWAARVAMSAGFAGFLVFLGGR